MTVNITKPAINLRSELADLRKPTGIAGEAMLRADTPQEQFNLIGAGRRNLIINGAMTVAQRGTSVAGLGATGVSYPTIDRMQVYANNTVGRATMSQESDGPSGFAKCLKMDCTTADTSIASDEYFFINYNFEGQDCQSLAKGTADATDITVSFWVKGNASATYALELYDAQNTRQVTKLFSVTSSWTRVELTFAGDTSGTLSADNLGRMQLNIWLHAGSDLSGGTASGSWERRHLIQIVRQGFQVSLAAQQMTSKSQASNLN
jgi:hypothetical protein